MAFVTSKIFVGLFVISGFAVSGCKQSGQSESKTLSDENDSVDPKDWHRLEAQTLDVNDYDLVPVDSDKLETVMVPGSQAQHLPENLRGIFWMDGNSLAAGNAFSFAKTNLDLANHRVLVTEYGENNYTFNDDSQGHKRFTDSISGNINYEVTFNSDYTSGRLIQANKIPGVNLSVRISKLIVDYTMDYVAPGDWLRRSKWGPKALPDYHMRRIVDEDGKHVEPAFTNFLKVAPKISLVPMLKNR